MTLQPRAPAKPVTAPCFVCGRGLRGKGWTVYCTDEQAPRVGPDCYKKVVAAGEAGYQPPLGGPRVWAVMEHAKTVGY